MGVARVVVFAHRMTSIKLPGQNLYLLGARPALAEKLLGFENDFFDGPVPSSLMIQLPIGRGRSHRITCPVDGSNFHPHMT